MRLSDLVRDDVTGRMSHTKLWNQVGILSILVAFNRVTWIKPDIFSLDSVMAAAAGVSLLLGTAAGSKYLASKSGVRVDQDQPVKP